METGKLSQENRRLMVGSACYFAIGLSEVLCEYFEFRDAIAVLKPMIPLFLMGLYWQTSERRHWLFFFAMSCSMLTNLFFLGTNSNYLFYAVIVFTFHRFAVIVYTLRLLQTRDYIPILIGSVPFFCLFSYVFKFANNVSTVMYLMIVLQNILISVFGGIALSNYIMKEDTKNSWLYMSGLLFVILQFVIFIERYYLLIFILRPIAMLLNVFAFYCFYRFVLSVESSNND